MDISGEYGITTVVCRRCEEDPHETGLIALIILEHATSGLNFIKK